MKIVQQNLERPADFCTDLKMEKIILSVGSDRYNLFMPIMRKIQEKILILDPPVGIALYSKNICMVFLDVIGSVSDAATPLRTFRAGKLPW